MDRPKQFNASHDCYVRVVGLTLNAKVNISFLRVNLYFSRLFQVYDENIQETFQREQLENLPLKEKLFNICCKNMVFGIRFVDFCFPIHP